MKKKILLSGIFLSILLLCPLCVYAAGAAETAETASVPLWLCIPFAGLLLCIAVMPLIKGQWWETHQPLAVIFWILAMVIPFAICYGVSQAAETVLECTVNDYLTFIILLFGLFCVSGNITMEGDFAGPQGSMWDFWPLVRFWQAVSARLAPVCLWCVRC